MAEVEQAQVVTLKCDPPPYPPLRTPLDVAQAHADIAVARRQEGLVQAAAFHEQTAATIRALVAPMPPDGELLPCPFCGSEAVIIKGDECAVAQCLDVKAHRLFVDGDNTAAEQVAEFWNQRPSTLSVHPSGSENIPEDADRKRFWRDFWSTQTSTL
jgi:hypothetical protein